MFCGENNVAGVLLKCFVKRMFGMLLKLFVSVAGVFSFAEVCFLVLKCACGWSVLFLLKCVLLC